MKKSKYRNKIVWDYDIIIIFEYVCIEKSCKYIHKYKNHNYIIIKYI